MELFCAVIQVNVWSENVQLYVNGGSEPLLGSFDHQMLAPGKFPLLLLY